MLLCVAMSVSLRLSASGMPGSISVRPKGLEQAPAIDAHGGNVE
jgi:hypothetical protein